MTGMTAGARSAASFADFAPITEINSVCKQLSAPRERIESRFLGMGSSLSECVQIIGRITALFDDLAQRASSAEGLGETSRLEALARQALALAGLTSQPDGDSNGLSGLMRMVGTVRSPVLALEKTVKLIGLVAVSTRINAAHLSGTREDFAVFTVDIGRLSDHVAGTVSEFASVYGKLVSTLAVASEKQSRFERTHRETMQLLVKQLDASLAGVDRSRKRMVDASTEMGGSFRRIASGIGTAVSALQIGDITRQRIEHVEEAFAMLLERHADRAVDPTIFPAIVAAVCRLQSAQASETMDQFDGEIRRLVDTLRTLATDAGKIVEQSGQIHGAVVEASRETTEELVNEVRRACELIRASEETREECDRAAGSVVSSLQDLMRCVEAVQEIEQDMQIVSLNMGLKCARLGAQGHTLSVIAQELRVLTGQTVVHARAAIGSLRTAAGLAQTLAARSAGAPASAVETLEVEAIEATRLQEAFDHELSGTLDALKRDGAQSAALLAGVAAQAMAGDEVRSALRSAGGLIETIRLAAVAAYAGAGGEDMAAAEAEAMAQLASRYTMVSERLTHNRLLDGGHTSEAAADDGDDLDALFL